MIKINNLKAIAGGEILFKIKNLTIANNKKVIAVIGANGSGKTTFANILIGDDNNFEGYMSNDFQTLYFKSSYFDPKFNQNNISGGEFTRKQISHAFLSNANLIILDEPSVNLDLRSKDFLIRKINTFNGNVILISHDLALIQKTANEIIEISDGELIHHSFSLGEYLEFKENANHHKKLEHAMYLKNLSKLNNLIQMREANAIKASTKPKNMSYSEWKLNKGGGNKVRKHLSKLNKEKDNLEQIPVFHEHNKKITFTFANNLSNHKMFLTSANILIKSGDKFLVTGDNGSGKTTLLNKIFDELSLKPSIKVGYFKQNGNFLNETQAVKDYVKNNIDFNELKIRNYLAQFKYKDNVYHKKIFALSEGEKVQLMLSVILSQEWDVIILDEPTNFLDINSLKMLQVAINEFQGVFFVVSHDQDFCQHTDYQMINVVNGLIQ